MGGGNSGMQGQRADEQGVLHPAWAFGKSFYYWQKKLRTQIVASAPELVPLEMSSPVEEELQIRYRGAELKLPSSIDMDAVAALLRSIQSL